MKVFFGNLEDPTLQPTAADKEVQCYPSAFWLEPHWRDTGVFTIDWLLACAKDRHVVLLVHPENVLESSALVHDFKRLIGALDTVILK